MATTQVQVDEGESLATQATIIAGYAMMKGWQVSESFVEEGVSGSVPFNERPAGAALFARVRKGDVIIAAKLDRVFRSSLDALQTVERFKAMGVCLHLIDLNGDVSGNGISALFLTIMSAVAQFERERIAERIRDVKSDQKGRNRFLGGSRPFGYQVRNGGLVEDETEQLIIRQMRAFRAEGVSLRGIKTRVEQMHHGVRLSHVAISRILAESDARGNEDGPQR